MNLQPHHLVETVQTMRPAVPLHWVGSRLLRAQNRLHLLPLVVLSQPDVRTLLHRLHVQSFVHDLQYSDISSVRIQHNSISHDRAILREKEELVEDEIWTSAMLVSLQDFGGCS